jgi:hypothetical protein
VKWVTGKESSPLPSVRASSSGFMCDTVAVLSMAATTLVALVKR